MRLADGTRFHAVLAPVARPAPAVAAGAARAGCSPSTTWSSRHASTARARLWPPIVAARLAFLVSGGTGSGKTTLLAALLALVDPGERLVWSRTPASCGPGHPHVVGLEARPANIEGAGAIVLRDLVRQALRMRPDRLVVGEVRGAEVVDLLAALNTGHEGGCGTVHANSAGDVPARVEALALAAGLDRGRSHSQFASGDRGGGAPDARPRRRRRLSEVAVPLREPSGLVAMCAAVTFDAAAGRIARVPARPGWRPVGRAVGCPPGDRGSRGDRFRRSLVAAALAGVARLGPASAGPAHEARAGSAVAAVQGRCQRDGAGAGARPAGAGAGAGRGVLYGRAARCGPAPGRRRGRPSGGPGAGVPAR